MTRSCKRGQSNTTHSRFSYLFSEELQRTLHGSPVRASFLWVHNLKKSFFLLSPFHIVFDIVLYSVVIYRFSISWIVIDFLIVIPRLKWRHNEHDSVSNHQPHYCLPNRLFRCRSKKTWKLRVTGLCVGNSSVTGEFTTQKASNAENVSIWWRHRAGPLCGRYTTVLPLPRIMKLTYRTYLHCNGVTWGSWHLKSP